MNDSRTIRLSDAIKVVQDNLAFSVKADIIKALSALPAVGGWLPIESAPKDGTEFVAWDTATNTRHVTHWEGRWYDPDNHYYSESTEFQPTHYMPLPAPPIE